MNSSSITIIIPARNEGRSLRTLLPSLVALDIAKEIVVVDDGSTDDTPAVCAEFNVRRVMHPYSMGNGAAIKSGVRAARGEVLIFMDGDGQHSSDDIPRLLTKLDEGYDMVVGARDNSSQASTGRLLANTFYNRFSSMMVGHKIEDLTSGLRAVRAEKFREFLYLLPNGFSYPTTSTMAFFRAGYAVAYIPIQAAKREGKSHIKPLKDGIRFLLIIFKIGTLYSPLKLFLPISLAFFLTGIGYYLYTFITLSRFTNMSALMLTTAMVIFLIGLVSEQITSLHYQKSNN